ncbi:MAG TPA: hypothetical protein VIK82_06320, partial [Porticoccaceae bacterium]
FNVLSIPDAPQLPLQDVTPHEGELPDMEAVRQQVLEAHRLLVKLNPRLMSEFVDLISALEQEKDS